MLSLPVHPYMWHVHMIYVPAQTLEYSLPYVHTLADIQYQHLEHVSLLVVLHVAEAGARSADSTGGIGPTHGQVQPYSAKLAYTEQLLAE